MSKFNQVIVSLVLPAIKAVGKAELSTILYTIRDNNTPEMFANLLMALSSTFAMLDEVAKKTATKIDDGLIDMVLETVQEVADAQDVLDSIHRTAAVNHDSATGPDAAPGEALPTVATPH